MPLPTKPAAPATLILTLSALALNHTHILSILFSPPCQCITLPASEVPIDCSYPLSSAIHGSLRTPFDCRCVTLRALSKLSAAVATPTTFDAFTPLCRSETATAPSRPGTAHSFVHFPPPCPTMSLPHSTLRMLRRSLRSSLRQPSHSHSQQPHSHPLTLHRYVADMTHCVPLDDDHNDTTVIRHRE